MSDAGGPTSPGVASALGRFTICDFSGQLAGAGATRLLAAFGARVIRVEDPSRQGRWDILRGLAPFVDDRRGIELGGAFNNHNVEKLFVTINVRMPAGLALAKRLIAKSDVVTENFAGGVMERLGLGYEALRELRQDIIYVSNSGFGSEGPYGRYKSWGPIVQANGGLTYQSALPGEQPAGWGYSWMDHMGAFFMATAIMGALIRRQRSGQGGWIDMACVEASIAINGPALLDYTVNGRTARDQGADVNSNRSLGRPMVPHGVYPCRAADSWVAIACRDEREWREIALLADMPADLAAANLPSRLQREDEIDHLVGRWSSGMTADAVAERLHACGVPCSPVLAPRERIEDNPDAGTWNLWPEVTHPDIGPVRVEGIPFHLSETDWTISSAAPRLAAHNLEVFQQFLGVSETEYTELRQAGAI